MTPDTPTPDASPDQSPTAQPDMTPDAEPLPEPIVLEVTIAEVRNPEDANHPELGAHVVVEGVVTAVRDDETVFWLSDPAGGEFSALSVYKADLDITVSRGQRVRVDGVYEEHLFEEETEPLTQLNLTIVGGVELVQEGATVAPTVVDAALLADPVAAEPYESVLVQVDNVTITNRLMFGEFEIEGGYRIDDFLFNYNTQDLIQEGQTLPSIVGIHQFNFGSTKVAPRDIGDVFTACDIALDADCDGFANTDDNCSERYNPLQNDGDEDLVGDLCDNCPEEPNNDQANEDGDNFGDACDFDFVADVTINELRDPDLVGQPVGTNVRIENVIVTAVRDRGFWVQDASGSPYSGIAIFLLNPELTIGDVQVGSVVNVEGEFTEFRADEEDDLTLSELLVRNEAQITVTGTAALPEPIVRTVGELRDAETAEPLESMLVRIEDVTIDSERGFGEWGFVGGYRLEDLIYDFNAEGNDPVVEDGAFFNAIVGVHTYSFNRYKIMPRSAQDFE
jgi:hypothetical protein